VKQETFEQAVELKQRINYLTELTWLIENAVDNQLAAVRPKLRAGNHADTSLVIGDVINVSRLDKDTADALLAVIQGKLQAAEKLFAEL